MAALKKELSLFGLTAIAIGSCIGVGVFVTPAKIANALPSPSWIVMVWAFGGILSLTGALTFAELGGLFPRVGGVYVFLKEAYNEFVAFLYGFAILLVITSGALAALARAFADYATQIVALSPMEETLLSIGVLLFLSVVNIFGVKIGEWFSNVLTVAKLIGIAGVICIGLFWMLPTPSHEVVFSIGDTPDSIGSAFFVALIGVFFSYGGWHHTSYLAAETKNPQQTVPRAMILGTIVVTVTYVLVNIAYLYMLPIETLAASKAVAAEGVGQYFDFGGQAIAILIMVSVFGTITIYTMTAPRIYFAMAADKIFFKSLAKVHPTYKTPINAILAQSIWAILLLLFWDTVHDLITYVVFMDLLFMALAAGSIFIFRKKLKEQSRPYKTWGYPVVPIIYIIFTLIFLVNTVIEEPKQALTGLGITLLGILFYSYFKRKN